MDPMKQQIELQNSSAENNTKAQVDQVQQPFQTVKIMSNSNNQQFYSLLMNEYQNMQGPPQQKIKRLTNRLHKFFSRDSKVKMNMIDSYFCPRRQPFYKIGTKQIQLLDCQVILFGIDFMSAKSVNHLFKPDLDNVGIDMSHCKLVFKDFESAMNSLRENQREEVVENVFKLDMNGKEVPKGWMEMRPYYFGNFQRRILARFATAEQKYLKKSAKITSNIPQYALKVYELKKKQHQDIQKNAQLRELQYRNKKYQKLQRRGDNRFKKQQDSYYNHENNYRNNFQKQQFNDKASQKSFNTLRIGVGYHKNLESNHEDESISLPDRQRSRQKDFDAMSVASKRSSVSSLVGRFDNNMNLSEKEDENKNNQSLSINLQNNKNGKGNDNLDDDNSSIVSNAQFLLRQNQQIFRQMAQRLNLCSINNSNQNKNLSQKQNLNDSQSSISLNSYRLTQNMPGSHKRRQQQRQTQNQSFNYRKYMEQRQKQQEIQNQLKRKFVVIDDDD